MNYNNEIFYNYYKTATCNWHLPFQRWSMGYMNSQKVIIPYIGCSHPILTLLFSFPSLSQFLAKFAGPSCKTFFPCYMYIARNIDDASFSNCIKPNYRQPWRRIVLLFFPTLWLYLLLYIILGSGFLCTNLI